MDTSAVIQHVGGLGKDLGRHQLAGRAEVGARVEAQQRDARGVGDLQGGGQVGVLPPRAGPGEHGSRVALGQAGHERGSVDGELQPRQ